MMSDNVELGCAALLRMGVDPVTRPRSSGAKQSTKWLRAAASACRGLLRPELHQHLENGDTWISQAWSGDIFQANLSGYPHLKYVTPKEGQMIWHDNMMIPRQSQNPLTRWRG